MSRRIRKERHLDACAACDIPVCISKMWNWLSDQRALRTGEATDVSACAIQTARSSLPCSVPSGPLLPSANSSSLAAVRHSSQSTIRATAAFSQGNAHTARVRRWQKAGVVQRARGLTLSSCAEICINNQWPKNMRICHLPACKLPILINCDISYKHRMLHVLCCSIDTM